MIPTRIGITRTKTSPMIRNQSKRFITYFQLTICLLEAMKSYLHPRILLPYSGINAPKALPAVHTQHNVWEHCKPVKALKAKTTSSQHIDLMITTGH